MSKLTKCVTYFKHTQIIVRYIYNKVKNNKGIKANHFMEEQEQNLKNSSVPCTPHPSFSLSTEETSILTL